MRIAQAFPLKNCARTRLASRLAAFLLTGAYAAGVAFAAAPPITLSQTPLTITIPAHPQVIIAIGNSQSMDGTLSGAIMTGAGSLGSSYSLLASQEPNTTLPPSSPLDYAVPSGFTPPVTGGTGSQPNTANCIAPQSTSELCDNSPSRLNIAKAAITSVLSSYVADTDFALMDYKTSSVQETTTWLYVMSPTSGPFVFTDSPPAGTPYVANPCYNYTATAYSGTVVAADCASIDPSNASTNNPSTGQPVATVNTGLTLANAQYMEVSASSDDADINDVFYGSGADPLCLVFQGPSPPNPWPPNFSLSQYNSGGIGEYYSNALPSYSQCYNVSGTGPTNAGFVPYSPETMYIERGFGYLASTQASPGSSYWSPLVTFAQGNAGQNPTSSSVATALGYFKPFLAPETNSADSKEIKASAEQSPLAGLLKNAQLYFKSVESSGDSSSTTTCAPDRYIILVTDGLPTMDLNGNAWPPPGSISAQKYGETVNFNSDGSLDTSNTNDQALLDTISELNALREAGIKTYIVGLGAGATGATATDVLTAMAIAGGTSTYFPATDPTTLTNDLTTILGQVQHATQSVSSSAVNSTGIHVGSVAYQAQFTSSDTNEDWTGNLYAFPIDPTTGYVNTTPSDALWNAQSLLDGLSWQSRVITTWDPVANKGIPFEWTTGSPTSGIASSTTLGKELSTNTADTNGQDVLDYLRGDRQLEQAQGGPFRTRTHVLGDIVDSAPLYVGAPSGPYLDASYTKFEQQYASRPSMIYVGANDGMLHAFNAQTGKEVFAYVPNGVFSNLIQLTYPLYNQNHLFYVDGSPGAWDVQFSDSSWHTVLVSGEGAGGKSIFALDVTNPAGMTTEAGVASDVLWEFSDSDLGYTFGTPTVATTSAGTYVFFGNGYDSTPETPYLYALNPQTGAVAAKINLCSFDTSACNTSEPNGLSAVTVVNSSGGLTGANVLYAGDLQGNVWRVDLSSSNPANWTASLLFKAVDASGNAQPITMAPVVTLNPDFPRLPGLMVYVGTGELLSTNDLTSSQVQSIYGLYDAMPNTAVITRSQLVQQTISATTVTTVNGTTVNARSVTSNQVDLPKNMGWYIDLSVSPGEAVVTEPTLIEGALFVTTNEPLGGCTGGFNSWFYDLNFRNGGLFPTPLIDVTESGSISSTQPSVAAVSLGDVYASAPRVASGSLGTGSANLDIFVNESGNANVPGAYTSYGQNQQPVCSGTAATCGDPILNVLGKGGGQSRTAWWEIR